MTEPTRYPLAWPVGRPRRKVRTRGQFSESVDRLSNKTRPVSLQTACERVEAQVDALGGIYPILSTNIELRVDGRPRADRAPPLDPGVCLYFQLKGKPYAMACDTYTEVAQNVAAVAAHIEATRRIERYGVATAAEVLQAFTALPPPTVIQLPEGTKPWREVLGFHPEWPDGNRSDDPINDVQRRYRARSIEASGESEQQQLNIARDAALRELKP